MKALTLEEAVKHLETALKENDRANIDKWDFIIRAENDFRVRNKMKAREIEQQEIERAIRRSYILP